MSFSFFRPGEPNSTMCEPCLHNSTHSTYIDFEPHGERECYRDTMTCMPTMKYVPGTRFSKARWWYCSMVISSAHELSWLRLGIDSWHNDLSVEPMCHNLFLLFYRCECHDGFVMEQNICISIQKPLELPTVEVTTTLGISSVLPAMKSLPDKASNNEVTTKTSMSVLATTFDENRENETQSSKILLVSCLVGMAPLKSISIE